MWVLLGRQRLLRTWMVVECQVEDGDSLVRKNKKPRYTSTIPAISEYSMPLLALVPPRSFTKIKANAPSGFAIHAELVGQTWL